MVVGGKKKGPKDRKPKVRKPGKKLGELYEISGDSLKRKNRNCPKCGKGTFLGKHKNRLVCGKCGYVEILEKKE
ncbi:30S ribosomal protein S27ae [Candidatus Woesearchaeota archaeon]|nr:30S ribosomal protein S27ae [Candidatus Woesearchaeota archaeon]